MPEVRPIDANALKKDLSEFNYDMALRIVDTQPTIEPEVRHGRWIFDEYTAKYGHPYKCSECKEESRDTYDYCPCCGARMDGGAENG